MENNYIDIDELEESYFNEDNILSKDEFLERVDGCLAGLHDIRISYCSDNKGNVYEKHICVNCLYDIKVMESDSK